MTPAKVNLTIYQGATFSKVFQYKTGNPPTAVNMSLWSGRMQIRPNKKSSEVLLELTTEGDGIVILDQTVPENVGKFSIFIDDVDTAELNFTHGEYDLELEDADGFVRRILMGSVTLNKEVTRPVPVVP
jgi:hypothetical protein